MFPLLGMNLDPSAQEAPPTRLRLAPRLITRFVPKTKAPQRWVFMLAEISQRSVFNSPKGFILFLFAQQGQQLECSWGSLYIPSNWQKNEISGWCVAPRFGRVAAPLLLSLLASQKIGS